VEVEGEKDIHVMLPSRGFFFKVFVKEMRVCLVYLFLLDNRILLLRHRRMICLGDHDVIGRW
jgi:hypothetical protein